MFCSQCGTKVNEGAKFCFNCGAKIVGAVSDTNRVTEIEKKIPEEFVVYVEDKCIEAYVQGKKVLAETFYKKADFYEVQPEQVKKIVSDCENKVSKIEKYIDGLYEECKEFELYEEEYDEITAFGNSLGFDDEEVEEIVDYYEQRNYIEEKQKLYSECVLDYVDNGKTRLNSDGGVEKYQEVVYKVFEKNILYMEKLLEEQYRLTKEFELNQEQKDLIYLEGSKRFPEETIVGIIFGYDKKNGILKFREEKEKQKALERMKFFDLYGEQIAFTEEECIGITVGKNYRKVFNRLQKEFSTFSNNADVTEEGYWDAANEKVIYLIKVIYEAMVATLEKKGVSQEDISGINAMDLCQYWITVFEDIDYKYNEICYGIEAAEYYRRFRKEARGKIIGGGFGLVGAAKGIVTAGAINAMTGAAHSAFNFVGNIKDGLKKRYAIKELLGYSLNKKVGDVLKQTLQWAYLTELSVLRSYNVSSKGFQLFYYNSERDTRNVSANLLKIHPFNEYLYEDIIMLSGVDNGIDKLAQFTGMEIGEIKAKRKQKEIEERTEDGIVFSTVQEKDVYCKEKLICKPLFDEIRQTNIWVERQKYIEKIEVVKQMKNPTSIHWKKEKDELVKLFSQLIEEIKTPNEPYLTKVVKVSIGAINEKTIVAEENEYYEYLKQYFKKIIQFERDERAVLFITDCKEKPNKALVFTTKHNYYLEKEKYESFDFDHLKEIRYDIEKGTILNDKILRFEIVLQDGAIINITSLFNNRTTVNYRKHKELLEALRECVEISNDKAVDSKENTLKNSNHDFNTSKNSEKAIKQLHEKYELALCYLNGKGVEKNVGYSVKLLKELAESGLIEAQMDLAAMYFQGNVVERNIKNTIKYLTMSAENNNAKAQYLLGWTYSSEYNKNENNDDVQAVFWFNEAVKNGDVGSWDALATHYFYGLGVERDYNQALNCLAKGIEYNDDTAKYHMGQCYEFGTGVEKSEEKALYWYNEAAKQGNEGAKKRIKKLKGGCYITSAVCNSFGKEDDCYELQMFRKFRDEWLSKQPDGEMLIKEYYSTAPDIVKVIDINSKASTIYSNIWNQFLEKCLSYIEQGEFVKCKRLYVKMVEVLKSEFLSK